MKSRNLLLIRSIAFAAVTKIAGSLIVFIGLPIISHSLKANDYATFLRSMSAASLLTLWLGATVALSVRTIAHALASGDEVQIRAAERSSAGLFVLTTSLSMLVTLSVVLITLPHRVDVVLLAVCLSAIGGLLLWGDAYRVALRSDHISSMWQLLSTVVMLILLILFSAKGVLAVVFIYFGAPLVAQLVILLHLRRSTPFVLRPTFGLKEVKGHIAEGAPLLLNSIAEYLKIFGSGLIFSHFLTVEQYARFVTIVVLIARLTNPVSLITRPLMPTYIDAIRSADVAWLRVAARVVVITAVGGALVALIVAALFPTAWLNWLLPPILGRFTRIELFLCAIFLWGNGLGGLMSPLYVAQHKQGWFAAVNSGFVIIGVGFGCLAALEGQTESMLASMSLTTGAAGAILTWIAFHNLFKLDDVRQYDERELLSQAEA